MVLISSKKYACETCIKGHRSSTCKHTDRPLYEIKKKGRPVTQCEHCRELRKTKQVHVKCICEVKTEPPPPQPSSNGKKGTKIPSSAAFPNGLPQELEAVVASQIQEEFLSDSLHGVKEPSSCACKSGGSCQCCTPRNSAARRNTVSDINTGTQQVNYNESPMPIGQSPPVRLTMSHILARVKELRPVLPRPASSNSSGSGPIHDLSSGVPHSHPTRHHIHDNVMFSPYGRAHDRAHDHPLGHEKHHPPIPPTYPPFVKGENVYDQPMLESDSFPLGSMPLMLSCGCGGATSREPNNATIIPNADTDGVANTCLDSSFLLPPSSQQSNQRMAIDEWLSQVPLPTSAPNKTTFQSGIVQPECRRSGVNNSADPTINTWDQVALLAPFNHRAQHSYSSDDIRTHASTPEYSGSQCSCPPQSCQCPDRSYFFNNDVYNHISSANGKALGEDERFGQLQMSQGMSRSDTHLVLPDLYQTRPYSTPLQRGLGALRPNVDFPYSASTSALDGEADYVSNSQSVVQALLDFPILPNMSMTTPSLDVPWLMNTDDGAAVLPMYPYAMSSSGTDGTSSYDDLSTTLRTPL